MRHVQQRQQVYNQRFYHIQNSYRYYGLSLLLGSVASFLVLVVWQLILQEEQQLGITSSLPSAILFGGLLGAWMLTLVMYLALRSERYARQAQSINQQLQTEIRHRQRVEANLRISEERWQLALRGNNDGIWDWNVQTNEVFFSSRWKEMLGFAEHEISDTLDSWTRQVHPDDLNHVRQLIEDHFAKKTPFYISEHRVRCKDGSYKWILDRGQALWNEAGQAIRMAGSHTDITERKQSEAALQASEAKYRNLVNHLNVGFVVYAPDTRILQCNATACEVLGLSQEQMMGKVGVQPTWQFVHEDGTRMLVHEYPVNQVLATQAPLKNYVLGIDRDTQARVWVLVTAFPEFDANRQLTQVVVTFIDISRLKEAEADLRAITKAMEDAISGFSKLDSQGYYLYVNKAYAGIAGYHPEEMVGLAWQQTVHPSDLEKLSHAYQTMLQDGKVEVEARGIRKDGSIFYKQLVMLSNYDAQQRLVGHYCFMKDISERARLAAERQEAEAKLQRHEALLAEAQRMVHLGNWELDILTQKLTWSEEVFRMFGFEPTDQEPTYADYCNHIAPDERELFLDYLEQAMTQGSPYDIELKFFRKDGSVGYMQMKGKAKSNDQGKIDKIFGTALDITERKQAELSLEKELLQSNALFNTSMDGVVVMNSRGDVVQASPSFARMLGYTMAETLTLNVADWDVQWTREELQEILTQEHFFPLFETRHRRQDGSCYDVEISYSRVEIDGEMMHFCICRDITDRKHAEISLQNSQARFSSILEFASDAIISVNVHQRITLFNKGAERIFGYSAHEVIGQSLSVLLPDRLKQAHSEHVSRYALSSEGARFMAERGAIFGRRKDGGEFPAEASISKISLNNEVIFTVFLRDITDRQQAEAALRESEEKFRMAIDFTYDWEYWQAPDGSLVYVSPSCERITGYTPAEFIQNPGLMDEIVYLGDRSIVSHHACSNPSKTEFIQFRIINRAGEIRWLAHICQPVFNSRGEYLGKRASNRDISERVQLEIQRQQAEQALRESEATKQAIIQAIPDLLIRMQANGEYIDFITNNTFNIVNPDRVRQGVTLHDVLPKDLADLRLHYAAEALQSSTTQVYEQEILVVGKQCYEEVRIVPLPHDEVLVMVRDITDRKQAEVALQAQKTFLQQVIDAVPSSIFVKNNAGQFLIVNQAAAAIYGVSVADMLGKQDHDLNPNPSQSDDFVLQNQQVQQSLKPITFPDQQITDRTGVHRWYQTTISPFFDIDGCVQGIIGNAIEVSDRKQAEVALQFSQERLQLALDASGDGLWDWDIETGDIYHSPRYYEMLGYEADQFDIDLHKWKVTIHPDDKQRVLDCLESHLNNSAVKYTLDYRVRCKSGQWKWITDYGKVVARDAQEKPLRMIGAYKDISDRKQVEEDLRHQKEMLQAIINHIPAMISLFNPQGRIEFINPEFERILGWSLEEWQQQDRLSECYPESTYCQQVVDFMLRADGTWQDFTTLTASQIQIETTWANVRLSNGYFLGIGQDISDRKHKELALRQAMEAAEAANLAKSTFLANMSHELRTPLNVILGFAQVMSHDMSLTPTQQEDLQTIRRSGDHLLSLINDVLDLSKIEAGHCVLEETEFDLLSLLQMLRTMMSERAKAKYISLDFDIAPDIPQFIVADEQKLRQILLNLLSNAIKFTNQGGVTLRVTHPVSLEEQSSPESCPAASHWPQRTPPHSPFYLQFEIIDTGVGIAANEQCSIFDAFVQAEAGKALISGTGLGLAISRELLELMQGAIAVRSVPNEGSTFTVTLPVYPASGHLVQPQPRDRLIIGPAPNQPSHRLLIVDDQAENRLVLVRLFRQLKLEVWEAANGQEAIQLWQDWHPDLIWMDIRLPGMDGYETTRQIRAREQGKACIIIALTAQASQSDRALALAAGCNDYISKPFREETLLLKLKEYLGLEYLYAERDSSLSSAAISFGSEDISLHLDETVIARLSPQWLDALEHAAVCGHDRAITALALQLPPELSSLRAQLIDLADQFQFERILEGLQTCASRDCRTGNDH